jgi:hypothetical protein
MGKYAGDHFAGKQIGGKVIEKGGEQDARWRSNRTQWDGSNDGKACGLLRR